MPDGKPLPGGLILWEINTWAVKDKIQFHLTIEEDKSGRFTFHSGTDRVFIEHLLSEEKRLQKDGSWDWVQVRKQNHLLDCTAIAFGLADPEAAGGIMIHRPAPQTLQRPAGRDEKKPWIDTTKGPWIQR